MRMKMGNKILWLMSCLLFCGQVVWGEKLTLQEAIQLAQASSPEAEAARHTYRAAYWSYRSFRPVGSSSGFAASLLPVVNKTCPIQC